MNDFDPALALELDLLAPPAAAAADWSDVLARSGHGRRPVGVPVVAAVVLAVAVLATPALGIRGRVGGLLGFHTRTHPGFVAALTPVPGSRAAGNVIAVVVKPFAPTPLDPIRTVGFARGTLSVTVAFDGLSGPATAARIRVAPPRGSSGTGFVVRLCGPCTSGTTVRIHHRGLFLALLAHRGTAEIDTAKHPDGELKGRLRPT